MIMTSKRPEYRRAVRAIKKAGKKARVIAPYVQAKLAEARRLYEEAKAR